MPNKTPNYMFGILSVNDFIVIIHSLSCSTITNGLTLQYVHAPVHAFLQQYFVSFCLNTAGNHYRAHLIKYQKVVNEC